MDMTGFPDGAPTRVGVAITDYLAGLYAVQGILLALTDRQKSGLGQHVDIALFESMLSVMRLPLSVLLATGNDSERVGNDHLNIAPYEPLRAKDGLIIVAVANPGLWGRFCDAIGRPDLRDDPRFRTNTLRVTNRGALKEAIEAVFQRLDGSGADRTSPGARTCRAAASGRSARRSHIRRSPRADRARRPAASAGGHGSRRSRRSSGCRARRPKCGCRRPRSASTPRKYWRDRTSQREVGRAGMMTRVFQPSPCSKNRVALITGGGTGICRGIALAFAAHGCDVAITSRKPEHLEPTRDELRALGVRAIAKAADVRDPAAVNDAVSGVMSELGRLDIVVNGAAGNFICLAENLSPNGFGTVVDIDLKGTFNVSRAALPHLKAQGGSVSTSAPRCRISARWGRRTRRRRKRASTR